MTLKFSIITPSYNQAAFVEQTILSVVDQPGVDTEHIIIDGGSTDETLSILKRYPHLTWVSEKDRGQADALRKGLRLATGDIVGWINSDDYYQDQIFSSVAQHFQNPDTMWVIGNLAYVFDSSHHILADQSPMVTYQGLLKNPDIVRQQPTFFRREFLIHAGGWNPRYFMVMDYDLWIRLAKKSAPKMVDETFAFFRLHTQQKTSHANILRQYREISEILRREHVGLITRLQISISKRTEWTKGVIKSYLIRSNLLSKRYQNRPIRLK